MNRLDEIAERRFRRRSKIWAVLILAPIPLAATLPIGTFINLPPGPARTMAASPLAVAVITGAGMLYIGAGTLTDRSIWTVVPLSILAGAGFAYGQLVDLQLMGALAALPILALMQAGVYQTVKARRVHLEPSDGALSRGSPGGYGGG